MITFTIILVLLIVAELAYFKIADRCNIIDRPNERSSHSTIVLRGGGIIFLIGVWMWCAFFGFHYPWFLIGLTLIAGISFVDDIHSLPDSVRLVVQFMAMLMLFYEIGLLRLDMWWGVIVALVICVGIINVFNFMDGINGITGGYSLAVVLPLLLLNNGIGAGDTTVGFVDNSLLVVTLLSLLVFCFFNFRPRGKARCFAGDVGSVGIAFILLFFIGRLVIHTSDISYLIFTIVYGADACMTIAHRVMLHEHLGEAHRKHAYQLMSNELGMSHVTVSIAYMLLQLVISLSFVYLIPNTVAAHWIFLVLILVALCLGYYAFMRKYYHLHEEYLAGLKGM